MSTRIHAALRSGTGCVRTGNEDAWYLNGAYAPLEQMNDEVSRKATFPAEGALFAVCDGVGGERNGEVASFTAVSSMTAYQSSVTPENFADESQAWIRQVNSKVLEASHGGCTLAMVFILGNAVHVGHIGDSRVYRFSQGVLERITRDHSKVQMLMDAGLITPEQAAVHPQRHVITRSLGMDEEDGICSVELEDALPVVSGDRYLICSDGVTDMVTDAALAEMLRMGKSADDCAEAIYRAALNAGGKDNTTLIVLEPAFEGAATAPVHLEGDETMMPEEYQAVPPTDGQPAKPGPEPESVPQAAPEAEEHEAPRHGNGRRSFTALSLAVVLIGAGLAGWQLTKQGSPVPAAGAPVSAMQTADAIHEETSADTKVSIAETQAASEEVYTAVQVTSTDSQDVNAVTTGSVRNEIITAPDSPDP